MPSPAIAALPNGLKLPYVEQGNADGIAVLLLHAFADSWRSFEHVLPHLPHDLHVFAVTQRGHGDASKPADGYAVEDFAADAIAFLDVVGVDAAMLVASSSASLTAQRVAADHPERVSGLVFIGAPRSLRDNPNIDAFLAEVRSVEDPLNESWVREFVGSTVSDAAPSELLDVIVAENLKAPAHVWRATVEGLAVAVPGSESATIAAPTAILWGDHDGFLPRADQEALAAAIPGADLIVYEGAGHAVHWEQPERVAADIAALARSLR